MTNHFTDKKILVVGGSSGIGEATARAFAEAGAHVTIASRNLSKLQSAASRIGHHTETAILDTADDSAVQRSGKPVASITLWCVPRPQPGLCVSCPLMMHIRP